MLNRMKIKVIAGVLVVFVAGLILGGLGTTGFIFHKMRQFAEGSGTMRHRLIMQRLSRKLDLTPEQKPQVQEIVEASNQEIQQLLRTSLQEFAEIMHRQRAALRAILTPEQQEKLDQSFRHMRNHWLPQNIPAQSPEDEY